VAELVLVRCYRAIINFKPPIKLFSWKRATLPLATVFGLVAYRAYEQFQKKGHLEPVDLWKAAFVIGVTLGIFTLVGWWANRPD
jgi:hypothetical protein